MLAACILRYGCGILSLAQIKVSKLDVATRKAMNRVGMHQPTADVDQLYVWHSEGGHELLNFVNVLRATIVSIATYLAVGVFPQCCKIFPNRTLSVKTLPSLATNFQNEYFKCHTVHTRNPTGEAKRAGVSLKKSMHYTSLDI